MEIKQIVDRMVEIKQESNALQDEYLDLQSKLQVCLLYTSPSPRDCS